MKGPMVYLVLAGVLFSANIGVFVYATKQVCVICKVNFQIGSIRRI